MAEAYIGTSGWNYKHWAADEFYPKDLKPRDWLIFFARHFRTVEINNSFYRLPSEQAFQNWRMQVPHEFVFSVKASRYITHLKRLKDPADPLALFFSRATHLKDKLGPVLFQLPPGLKFDTQRIEVFLNTLRQHTSKSNVRCAIEVRDPTWLVEPFYEMLHAHGVALCLADWRDTHVTGPVTADFVYIRRHYGPGKGGNYPRNALDRDVAGIRGWLGQHLDVYMYFNNDAGGHAVRNAGYVQQALSGGGRHKQRIAAD
jgi:uncharacterized protein YecE (DUF72 family)